MLDSRHPSQPEELPAQPVILIAEDNDDTRSMMRILIEAKGYTVVEADNGDNAIEIGMGQNLGLILLDLSLPESDGIAVIRRLRDHGRLRKTPIIVVSGWDRAQYEGKARNAGCNEYLSKPIDFQRLEGMLDRYAPLTINRKTPKVRAAPKDI